MFINQKPVLAELIQEALQSGATEAAIIPASHIIVQTELADCCREPRCENYGLSANCPPHVGGPVAFNALLGKYDKALFFKIDVPSDLLYSADNRELFQLLHETAAGIEISAIQQGYPGAKAFAGESCRKIFCQDYPECLALSAGGECRYPQKARPSMSGFGVNVAKLLESAGWEDRLGGTTEARSAKMAFVCGLVLLC